MIQKIHRILQIAGKHGNLRQNDRSCFSIIRQAGVATIFFAADLNDDTAVDVYDLAIINSIVNGETEISQAK